MTHVLNPAVHAALVEAISRPVPPEIAAAMQQQLAAASERCREIGNLIHRTAGAAIKSPRAFPSVIRTEDDQRRINDVMSGNIPLRQS